MATDSVDGLLLIDKPAGPTSHDVVAAARRTLGTRRIGHTGTLDPFATGLLLLLVGRVTRLAEYLSGPPKRYEARLRLGVATATDDATGSVIATSEAWHELNPAAIRSVLEAHVGERLQLPPTFSAKKMAGRRSYAAARQGETLPLVAAVVRIDSLRVAAVELPEVAFEVTCSAGTYIRAIARDVGIELGVPAHLVALRRTAIGRFHVNEATRLEDLTAERASAALRPPIDALRHLQRVDIDPVAAGVLMHGGKVALQTPRDTLPGIAAVTVGERLLAVAEVKDGWIVPRKVLANG
jgi:tRNA pseudouridine55 synthase